MNPFIHSVDTVKDPIPTFIEKLSAGEDLQVHIPSMTDTVVLKQNKKTSSLTVSLSSKETEFKFPKLERLTHIFSNRRSPNFPTQEQKNILSKLKQIPVYTVVNNHNEIITACPREPKPFNSLRWIQNKYNETFLWEYDHGPVSISLFFMHREDASSYLHEVSRREPKEAEISGLHVKTVSLDIFYKLNRTSKPKMQSRLVADLNEIDSILKKYRHDSFCTIHPKQKYSKTWFQGTPVYIMKLNPTLNKHTLTTYTIQDNLHTKIIFFTKEDATRAWHVYVSKTQTLKPQNNPVLEIYNLESLLLDSENSKLEELENLIIVPNYREQEAQKLPFSSKLSTKSTSNKIEREIFQSKLKLRDLERFYKGLVWLFTSDTLPSEENSW